MFRVSEILYNKSCFANITSILCIDGALIGTRFGPRNRKGNVEALMKQCPLICRRSTEIQSHVLIYLFDYFFQKTSKISKIFVLQYLKCTTKHKNKKKSFFLTNLKIFSIYKSIHIHKIAIWMTDWLTQPVLAFICCRESFARIGWFYHFDG